MPKSYGEQAGRRKFAFLRARLTPPMLPVSMEDTTLLFARLDPLMPRSSSRQTSLVCRLMIAFAILGTGLAPLCDAGRDARSVDGGLPGSDRPEALSGLDTEAGQPSDEAANESMPTDDADLPADGDDESLGFAGSPVLLVEIRANPRPDFASVGRHCGPALVPRRALISAPPALPRATDLPTRLCRWTC